METYEEVLLRNEPKNYTVRWTIAGKPEAAFAFTNFEEASLFAEVVREKDYVENVRVLRSGRHPSAKRWNPTRRERVKIVRKPDDGVFVVDEAWVLPEGYVDGDADKHGPAVELHKDNRMPARSNAEKAQWARENNWTSRMVAI